MDSESLCFYVSSWSKLKQVIKPVHYGISCYMMTEFMFKDITVKVSNDKKTVLIEKHGKQLMLDVEEMIKYPSKFFNSILKG